MHFSKPRHDDGFVEIEVSFDYSKKPSFLLRAVLTFNGKYKARVRENFSDENNKKLIASSDREFETLEGALKEASSRFKDYLKRREAEVEEFSTALSCNCGSIEHANGYFCRH